MKIITKRLTLYVVGLFLLSLGVSFSIQASLGVSPVSSLAYAFSLTSGLSIGITTILANILFIIVQVLLNKRIELREFAVQLVIVFLFGLFMDATLVIVQLLPAPETLIGKLIFLVISFYIISAGLLAYFTAKLPLMPYDALTYVISDRFNMKFSNAKITSDLLNVAVAAAVCLVFIHSLGSIGVGTLLAAYFIGKILGQLMPRFQQPLQQWVYKGKTNLTVEEKEVVEPIKSEK
ncbi:YczE/YyaS/YitT family protein [Sporosarcina sp. A2]|uniref:YczE/YyaS/YitT family protein n=1 Tax=Sporosarcina sp. A2 TaxID=3393449 RepID=UPI003D7BCBEE